MFLELSSFQPLQHRMQGESTKKLCSVQKNCARHKKIVLGTEIFVLGTEIFVLGTKIFVLSGTVGKVLRTNSVPSRTTSYQIRTKSVPSRTTSYQLRTNFVPARTKPYQPRTKGIFACSSHSDEGRMLEQSSARRSRVFRSTVPPDFQLNCCLFNRVVGVMIEKLPSTAK